MSQKILTILFSALSTTAFATDFLKTDNWDIQLSNPIISVNDSTNTKLSWIELDIDTDINTLNHYHQNGVQTVCYFSAGSAEKWRADFKNYPKTILGRTYVGFSDERWVNIKDDRLKPILQNRIAQCKAKGFFAVDPDNMNGYLQKTGFTIKKTDQIIFNKWLATEIHKNGMKAILKNTTELLSNLKYDFDANLTESCMKDSFCDQTKIFISLNKPVYNIEYLDSNLSQASICNYFKSSPINTIIKSSTFNIDSFRSKCVY